MGRSFSLMTCEPCCNLLPMKKAMMTGGVRLCNQLLPRLRAAIAGRVCRFSSQVSTVRSSAIRLLIGRCSCWRRGVLAVKSLGGYHLMARADQPQALQRLRQLKYRRRKPFAAMFARLDTVLLHDKYPCYPCYRGLAGVAHGGRGLCIVPGVDFILAMGLGQ